MQIVVDNLLTHYELSGKGKLVLLLHGWGDSQRGLSGLQSKLSANYQVFALDLPGFGATQPPHSVWDLDDYAKFVDSTLDKLKLGPLYAVVGHSNGGALAIRALSLQDIKAKKLVLLAASGIRTGGKPKRLILKFIAKLGNIATIWMPERYRRALRKSLYGVAGSDIEVVPQLRETFKQTVRQDVQRDAAKLDLPVLVIAASDDKAVPLADGRRYNQLIKDSKLEVVGPAGHFLHLDQPSKVTELIEDFLR